MSNAEIRGRFVWHELMTTDPQAAGAFYSKVLPWKTQPSGMPEYTLWMSGKTQAGGLMPQPESARQAGAPPSWLIYIGTPDVDSTAAAAQRLGGKVLKAPDDIPGIGRFAVLSDPQGAAFAIFTPGASAPPGVAPATDFTWHELATSDQQGAVAFYTELFGWRRGDAHDMGPMGTYQLIEHGGARVGGIFKLMDTSKAPHWLSYIHVASADRAAAAAKAAGGQVTQGPMEVPGGGRIAQILDPQGGAFAVFEPAKQAAAGGSQAGKAGSSQTAKASAASAESAAAKTRPAARKGTAKRAPARKPPAKRTAAKAKKRPAASKRAAKKSPARKAAVKRSAGRKSAAKKSVKKKSARKAARKK
jgi:predicted enzyme related to lactoylglutathione lyase